MSRLVDHSPVYSTSDSDSDSSIGSYRVDDSWSDDEVEILSWTIKQQSADRSSDETSKRMSQQSYRIDDRRPSSVQRALSFANEGVPLGVRVHSASQWSSGATTYQLVVSPQSFDNFCDQVAKRQAQKLEREAAELRDQHKRETQEAADRRAELKRARVQKMRSVVAKLGESMQRLLIVLGLLLVIYLMVEAMFPGTWQKQHAEIKQHLTQLWAESSSLSGRPNQTVSDVLSTGRSSQQA